MKFYRFVVRTYGSLDEFENVVSSAPRIECDEYLLIKETPAGYWIGRWPDDRFKWVSKTARKRFAYPDKVAALENLIRRTERRVGILKTQLKGAECDLMAAKDYAEYCAKASVATT